MKEKTLKDLGLDEGDKYLNKLSLDYDLGNLGDLSDILEDNKSKNRKDDNEKIKEIKDSV